MNIDDWTFAGICGAMGATAKSIWDYIINRENNLSKLNQLAIDKLLDKIDKLEARLDEKYKEINSLHDKIAEITVTQIEIINTLENEKDECLEKLKELLDKHDSKE